MAIQLSDDLLTEILLRLPARSLIRFKSVCKLWITLISSQQFSNRHTLHHRHEHSRSKPEYSLLRLKETSDYFYFQSSCNVKKLVPYYFPPSLVGPITIQSFSNGLILLQCCHVENPQEICHVYNPTTKQFRQISLNTNVIYKFVLGLSLAFDPLESPHFKIICVRATKTRSSNLWRSWWRRCQIEMYESDTDSWKVYGQPFLAPRSLDFNWGIYWKGSIHWKGIFFDLHHCVVKNHPGFVVPGDTGMGNFRDCYAESNGCLYIVRHFLERKLVMVFELQSDNSEWFLKYHVNLDGALGLPSVLSIIRGEDEEDSMLLFTEPGKLMAYNLQENCVKELMDFRVEAFYQEGCVHFASDTTVRFVETLAPV
ncbi:hypothetical protein ACS0TY_000305 [Phlomoides rotata]